MKFYGWVAAILMATVILAGCETWRGFGRDMQRAGRSIERSAQK